MNWKTGKSTLKQSMSNITQDKQKLKKILGLLNQLREEEGIIIGKKPQKRNTFA